ncbi:MAG TPA: TMEM175 family protein [Pyrinomonadaceae bacterium]
MIRESLAKREAEVRYGFRQRGLNDVSRVEALSDGVFAFAITLLVVSLEVPRTFDELLVMMRGYLAFAITFAMLFHVWHTQYRFFRRYGLNDNFTIWMTALLLFVVLFYVYPLKFVWTLMVNVVLGFGRTVEVAGRAVPVVRADQMPSLLAIYGVGFAAVFIIFALLYWHAYRKREALELNELETFDTRTLMQENALMAAVGLLSVGLALTGTVVSSLFAGLCYWLIGPVQYLYGSARGRRRKQLEQNLADTQSSPLDVTANF